MNYSTDHDYDFDAQTVSVTTFSRPDELTTVPMDRLWDFLADHKGAEFDDYRNVVEDGDDLRSDAYGEVDNYGAVYTTPLSDYLPQVMQDADWLAFSLYLESDADDPTVAALAKMRRMTYSLGLTEAA